MRFEGDHKTVKQHFSIRWQLPLSYAGIAFFAVVILGVMLLTLLQNHYKQQERQFLLRHAQHVKNAIGMDWARGLPLDHRLRWLSLLPQTHIELTNPDGEVIANSEAPNMFIISGTIAIDDVVYSPQDVPSITPNPPIQLNIIPFNDLRPERIPGVTIVYDETYGFEIIDSPLEVRFEREYSSQVVSIPVYSPQDQQFLGTITVSGGPAVGRDVLKSVTNGWLMTGGIAVLLAAGIGWVMSNRITTPLTALTYSTQQLAAGNLSIRSTINRQDELGILAHSFNRMAEQIENNIQTLKRFVADAAHEIHTPITALRTNLELSVENTPSPQNQQALNQVKQLERLTNDLLDLSQIESETSILFEPINLAKLMGELSEIYASRAEQADLEYVLVLPSEPVVILGSLSRIQRAFSNLLDNAVKFTPAGGQITVKLSQKGEVIIQDTGIGIPSDDLPNLFERFTRGRNAAQYMGSGLGLAIVKAIVDLHRGHIGVESDSTGTRITISFPHP
ncbi:MAG: hypothetical protein Kow00117_19190 [Phototrophicales bacterium]